MNTIELLQLAVSVLTFGIVYRVGLEVGAIKAFQKTTEDTLRRHESEIDDLWKR